MSTRKKKRPPLVIERPIFPLRCAIGDNDAKLVHYEVRFCCHMTGKEYCYDHAHKDACCVPMHRDIVIENEEVSKTYVFTLPKCPYCQIPLPPDLKLIHISACIKEYIKGFKARHRSERIFVPEKDLSYKESVPKERVVQFEEEP